MMTSRRPEAPELITNPLVKKRNLEWSLDASISSSIIVSPSAPPTQTSVPFNPATAAVEDGSESVTDPLTLFSNTLSHNTIPDQPTLSIPSYSSLYTRNANSPHGAHFVIHQHDHPIAGTHYDLRLQCNPTSSVSWAIMYGLPGDGNSVRLNRNATETRVHCLWNHLIETASSHTGSLLIWDTGTYTVLPRTSKHAPRADPDSQPSSSPEAEGEKTQQELLHDAFQNRKIRLQLHGSKLPERYILNLRLTKGEDDAGRTRAPSKRRRKRRKFNSTSKPAETSSEEDDREDDPEEAHLVPKGQETNGKEAISAMERELREMEDDEVRRTNAYTGASNTIGSVHQRKWYLSLDRQGVGYKKGKGGRWYMTPVERSEDEEDEEDEEGRRLRMKFPFYVKGVEGERSAVTGRKGDDILKDEGVEGYVGRKGWKPVLN